MAMTILYPVHDNLYVNLTNRCPCACTFCIRKNDDGVYGSDSLWLEHEPSFDEVRAAFEQWDLKDFKEIVFCGYGEPTERLDLLLQTARYLRATPESPQIRVNTNGLSDLINGKPTALLFEGLVDTVSISLNAGTEKEYLAVTRPKWDNAYTAMQAFALDCAKYVPKVMFTVVDCIPKEEIEAARALAEKLRIPLRVRTYSG